MNTLSTPVLCKTTCPPYGEASVHSKVFGQLADIAAKVIREHQPQAEGTGQCLCGEHWPCPMVCLAYHELAW